MLNRLSRFLICAAVLSCASCMAGGSGSGEGAVSAQVAAPIELELLAGRNAMGSGLLDLVPGAEVRCPVDESSEARVHRKPGGGTNAYHVNPGSRLVLSLRPLAFGLTRLENHRGDALVDDAGESTGDGFGDRSDSVVAVRAKFEPRIQAQLSAHRAKYPGCLMLVSIAEEIRWADPNGSEWSAWMPLGAFAENEAFVAAILADAAAGGPRADWIPWPEATAAARATEASRQRALEAYACDSELRASFEAAHPGAWPQLREELGAISCPGSE